MKKSASKKRATAKQSRKSKTVSSSGGRGSVSRTSVAVAKAVTVRGGRCSITVSNRELIDDIYAQPGDGLTKEYQLSPTASSTFPWLSHLAECFDYYNFKTLRFHYVPQCGSTVAGNVLMAFDYDVSDAHGSDRRYELAALEGAVSSHVFQEAQITGNPYHLHLLPHHYCNQSGTDPRLEAVGSFIVNAVASVTGTGTSQLCGCLWVEYVVDLFSPQFPEPSEINQQDRSSTTPNSLVFAPSDAIEDSTGTSQVVKSIAGMSGHEIAVQVENTGRYLLESVITAPIAADIDPQGPLTEPLGRDLQTKVSQFQTEYLGDRLDQGTRSWLYRIVADVLQGTPAQTLVSAASLWDSPTLWLGKLANLPNTDWKSRTAVTRVNRKFRLPDSTALEFTMIGTRARDLGEGEKRYATSSNSSTCSTTSTTCGRGRW